ncbi:MAG: peptidylprolyl isomerase [Dehalococcoidia bacterium]|nr:peptidylprolyl isomerase [Dehalococcoidia bacterium]
MTGESKRGRSGDAKPRAGSHRAPAAHRRPGLNDLLAMDGERSSRLLLVGAAVLVLLVALGFIAFGYYDTVIKPRYRTVLGADGITVSYTAMKQRMAYDIQQNPTVIQSSSAVQTVPLTAYEELLTEITLVSRGPSDQGIKVSDQELNTALDAKIGVATNAGKEAFAAAFRGALQRSGLSESAYRRIVLADVIKTKLQAKFQNELPATVPQAKLDVIQLNTKDAADKALARVKGGEAWATVAKDLSTDPDKATDGGTHDYAPEGDVSTAYSGFAFSAPVGQTSDVITSGPSGSETYYVVRVADRADKPFTAQQKPAAAQRRYNQWLDDMRAKMTITDRWTNDQTSQTKAIISVLNSLPPPTAVPTVVAPVAPATTPGASGTPAAGTPAAAGQPTPNGQPTAGVTSPVAPSAPVAPGGGNAP